MVTPAHPTQPLAPRGQPPPVIPAAFSIATPAARHENAKENFDGCAPAAAITALATVGAPAAGAAPDEEATAVGHRPSSSAGGVTKSCAVVTMTARSTVVPVAEAVESPRSLSSWLKEGPFVLSMAPGFFGFYAHIGALIALENEGLLDGVSFATGASAGGLVAGLFAAGLSPTYMGETAAKFRRSDFWDPVGFGGVLRGKKFEEIVKGTLPAGVRRFDQCRVPLAVSAFDVSRFTTRKLEEGCLAQALRATCTFPGLFAPVWHTSGILIDGGLRDTTGMWCVPEHRENCRRILNVTFGDRDGEGVCVPPSSFPTRSNRRPAVEGMEIVSLALTGLPRPHPFAMERGVGALEAARSQVARVIGVPLLKGHGASHWIAATTAAQLLSILPPVPCAAQGDGGSIPRGKCIAASSAAVCGGGGGGDGGNTYAIGNTGGMAWNREAAVKQAGSWEDSNNGPSSGPPSGGSVHIETGGMLGTEKDGRRPSTLATTCTTAGGAGCEGVRPAVSEETAKAGAGGDLLPSDATAAKHGIGSVGGTSDRKRKADAPLAQQGASTMDKGFNERLPWSGVACLRDFNSKGIAETAALIPDDSNASASAIGGGTEGLGGSEAAGSGAHQGGKRAAGGEGGEGTVQPSRTSKRARRPKIPFTG